MALTDAMVALYSTTLAAATSSVTIAGIPTTGYRDLYIVFYAKSPEAGNRGFALQANGDSGSNYSWVAARGEEGSSSGTSSAGTTTGFTGFVSDGSQWVNSIGHIMDYATDKHKTCIVRNNIIGSYSQTNMQVSRWANTAAINSLTFTSGVSTLSAGTTISLYGIKA